MLSGSEPGTVLDCKDESLTGRKVGRLPSQRDAAEVVVGMFSLVRSVSSGESRISDAHIYLNVYMTKSAVPLSSPNPILPPNKKTPKR
jgi:hypothetical protein